MLDLLKCFISLCITLFSLIALVWGSGYSIVFGLILFILCITVSVLILQSISSETLGSAKKYQDFKREQYLYKKYEGYKYGYICPCCGFPAGEKVGLKLELGYTYRCQNCHYVW